MNDIRCYRSPKIEIRSSPLKGIGIFATENIIPGEIVAIKNGHIVTCDHLPEITATVGDYALQIHDHFYLSPILNEELERMAIFINHSCNPNVGFNGQITYVSMRDIAPGEELCHDYAMERTDNYSLDCECGSIQCRHTVTGDDWKIPELQTRYGNYFAYHVLQKIRTATRKSTR